MLEETKVESGKANENETSKKPSNVSAANIDSGTTEFHEEGMVPPKSPLLWFVYTLITLI